MMDVRLLTGLDHSHTTLLAPVVVSLQNPASHLPPPAVVDCSLVL